MFLRGGIIFKNRASVSLQGELMISIPINNRSKPVVLLILFNTITVIRTRQMHAR